MGIRTIEKPGLEADDILGTKVMTATATSPSSPYKSHCMLSLRFNTRPASSMQYRNSLDGHSILNRAFYGVPDLSNSEGLHTNAVYGFLNIMFKILEEEQPDYLTVAFDVHAPTFRHEIYKEYHLPYKNH